jgi:hypothetical protein
MVLCWVAVVPLLLELSRVADVSSKTALRAIPQQQQLLLAAAVAGLGKGPAAHQQMSWQ